MPTPPAGPPPRRDNDTSTIRAFGAKKASRMGVVESSSSYRTPAMPPPCGLPSRLKNISSFSAQITVGGQAANPSEDVFRLSARKKKTCLGRRVEGQKV